MATVVRVTFAKAGSEGNAKPAMVKVSHKQLLKAASNKLRMKAKRLFLANGDELLADIAQADLEALVTNGTALIASKSGVPSNHAARIAAKAEAAAAVEAGAAPPAATPAAATRVVLRRSWLEDNAVAQLKQCAAMPHMRLAVGMPDLHAGKGVPIGTAFASEGHFYPFAIGGDIGCGMSLVQTSVSVDKATQKRRTKWATQVRGMDRVAVDVEAWLQRPCEWPKPVDTVSEETFGSVAPTDADAGDEGKTGDGTEAPAAPTPCAIRLSDFNKSLGTVGGGNHFAEIQEVESIVDAELFDKLGLDATKLVLMVHSGSRGLGGAILGHHAEHHGTKPLCPATPEGDAYLRRHTQALAWAKRNRKLIAHRILTSIGESLDRCRCVVDVWHNFLARKEFEATALESTGEVEWVVPDGETSAPEVVAGAGAGAGAAAEAASAAGVDAGAGIGAGMGAGAGTDSPDSPDSPAGAGEGDAEAGAGAEADRVPLWLHRKGAAPADCGPVVIPGSRGAFSYLVLPVDPETQDRTGFSLAHGAGRKWARTKANGLMRSKVGKPSELTKTALGSQVVCDDKDLLLEEAPQCYKDIDAVIGDLQAAGLLRVVAVFRPVLTYKCG